MKGKKKVDGKETKETKGFSVNFPIRLAKPMYAALGRILASADPCKRKREDSDDELEMVKPLKKRALRV